MQATRKKSEGISNSSLLEKSVVISIIVYYNPAAMSSAERKKAGRKKNVYKRYAEQGFLQESPGKLC